MYHIYVYNFEAGQKKWCSTCNRCNSQFGAIGDRPMKLIFRLHNSKEKEIQNLVPYLGSYNILSPDLVNGKPYWIHKHDANNAIWYNSTYKAWIFGPKVMIGSTTGQIVGFNGSLPYEAQTWSRLNNDNELINISTDVVVELGK